VQVSRRAVLLCALGALTLGCELAPPEEPPDDGDAPPPPPAGPEAPTTTPPPETTGDAPGPATHTAPGG